MPETAYERKCMTGASRAIGSGTVRGLAWCQRSGSPLWQRGAREDLPEAAMPKSPSPPLRKESKSKNCIALFRQRSRRYYGIMVFVTHTPRPITEKQAHRARVV